MSFRDPGYLTQESLNAQSKGDAARDIESLGEQVRQKQPRKRPAGKRVNVMSSSKLSRLDKLQKIMATKKTEADGERYLQVSNADQSHRVQTKAGYPVQAHFLSNVTTQNEEQRPDATQMNTSLNESAFVAGTRNRKVKVIAQLNSNASLNESGFVDVLDDGSGRSGESDLNTSKSQALSLIASKLQKNSAQTQEDKDDTIVGSTATGVT